MYLYPIFLIFYNFKASLDATVTIPATALIPLPAFHAGKNEVNVPGVGPFHISRIAPEALAPYF